MNQGIVMPQNKGVSDKIFNGNEASYKKLPHADGLKEFKQPSPETDHSVFDRDHSGVTYNKTKS